MADVKVTKAMILAVIKANAEDMIYDGSSVTPEDVVKFVDSAVAQIEHKNERAREKAAEKAKLGDQLRDLIKGLLTDELQTREEIFNQIEDETGDLTVAKIGAKLTQLVGLGEARKEQVKRDARRVMGYALVLDSEPVDAADVDAE